MCSFKLMKNLKNVLPLTKKISCAEGKLSMFGKTSQDSWDQLWSLWFWVKTSARSDALVLEKLIIKVKLPTRQGQSHLSAGGLLKLLDVSNNVNSFRRASKNVQVILDHPFKKASSWKHLEVWVSHCHMLPLALQCSFVFTLFWQ